MPNPPMIYNPRAKSQPFWFFNPGDTDPRVMSLNSIKPISDLFQGYDSVLGSAQSSLITGSRIPMGLPNSGQANITVCESTTELSRALNIDQSLSVSAAGLFSVNEKVTFLNELNISTYSLCVVASATRASEAYSTDNYQISPISIRSPSGGVRSIPRPAIDLGSRTKLKDFFSTYGDSFISSFTKGGEFFAVYVFQTRSERERTDLKIALDGKGIASGATISGEFNARLETVSKENNISSIFHWKVSGISEPGKILPDPHSPDANNAAVLSYNFMNAKLDAPCIVRFTRTGYEEIPHVINQIDKFKSSIAVNRNYFVGTKGNDNGLVRNLVQLNELLQQRQLMEDSFSAYSLPLDNELKIEDQILLDIAKIQDQIDRYELDPTTSFEQLEFQSLNRSPDLGYQLVYGNELGLGRDAFDNANVTSPHYPADSAYFTNRQIISSIALTGTDFLQSITVTYANITPGGVQFDPIKYGIDGENYSSVALPKRSVVTSISGSTGDIIDRLHIEISDGGFAEAGGGGGRVFDTWQVPPNTILIGFKGKTNIWTKSTSDLMREPMPVVGQLQPVHLTLLTRWNEIRNSKPPKPPVIPNPYSIPVPVRTRFW